MKTVFGGVAAGFTVALGGAVYLSCDNKYVGAVLFAVALLAICYLGFALFTGKAGFIVASHTKKDVSELLLCLPGNLIGAFLGAKAFAAASPDSVEKAAASCAAKLSQTMPQAFFKALLCGVLMYAAVAIFRKKNSPLGVIFCIPVFILSGFEHSIADMFYFSLSEIISLEAFIYIWIIILGNFVGSAAIAFLDYIKEEKPNEKR